MKKDQANIFFLAAQSREEADSSPFVERLLKLGFEVLYLTEPVDEYTIQNLPEFEGKKFQNAAKEGLKFGDETEEETKFYENLEKEYEPLGKWLSDTLKDDIEKTVVSHRLADSPCALVANAYGWSGNMERIMKAQAYARSDDSSQSYYANQKKVLEINPRTPSSRHSRPRSRTSRARMPSPRRARPRPTWPRSCSTRRACAPASCSRTLSASLRASSPCSASASASI